MSSKISQVYYLTEYSFGRTIQAWPKLRYRATSANAVSTLGFRDREMTKNPRFAQSANRRIGILPASQTAKRQSERNRKRPEAVTPSRLKERKLLCQNNARLTFTSRTFTLPVNNMGIGCGCCLGGNPNHRLLLSRGIH